MSEQRPEWEERIRKALDDSVTGLPAEVRTQLTQARHRALTQPLRTGLRPALPWLIPAGGVAAATLAIAVWYATTPPAPTANVASLDMELLLGDENLELIDELDFLIWLEEEQSDAS